MENNRRSASEWLLYARVRVLKHTNTRKRKDEAKLETKKTRQKEVGAEGVKRRLSRSYGADSKGVDG